MKEIAMASSFEPQFHKRVLRDKGDSIWVALPQPRTLLPVKITFYRRWQCEERLKLEELGETVLKEFGG
ncbi:hypothetical protein [Janthinobacterium sp. 17J80-10]|uniref:hypothetical protein n=1 Tax=Janthinobacterium sp. 17J80-10 TaxID=2497863 RepID=UPI00100572BD|nr:hypothetical protein [Janthinobacterium sp. 17J80-10]QAU33946.1 hypothetical protein EKL02_06945 [Janthinobacterium sp. 17J80-10]